MQYSVALISALVLGVSATPKPLITAAPKLRKLVSRADLPASSDSSALAAVRTIAAGESFDGSMIMFDRGVSCTGQAEGGDADAVFILEEGASISNVIIGPDQSDTTFIRGGGAFGAEDKVIQHNGGGTVSISDFTVEDFGKLYRSCGNCDEMFERHVIIDGVTASAGSVLAGINSNYGDTATFSNIVVSDVDSICDEFEGNDTGDEPEQISSGPSSFCLYDESDITEQ